MANKQPSLFRRIFIALALISAITSIVVLISATSIYQRTVIDDAASMLENECTLLVSSFGEDAPTADDLAQLELGEMRITVVGADGTVLYDNENDAAAMENHMNRPEVAEAFEKGSGASTRESETEGKVVIYRSGLLKCGEVVRLEVERDSVAAVVQHSMMRVVAVAAVAVGIAWVLARVISKRLMQPILEINPANPEKSDTYLELNPVIDQISEQMNEIRSADLMRRQFTSNVTHELKTPLSSISGASELIRDGIARPEDVPEFANRIYGEAAHMTDLVNDILTLSKLDEAERSRDIDLLGKMEPVDLHQASLNVIKRLEPLAAPKGVELVDTGEAVVIQGIPRLLDDLIYNLIDNAIRYSKESGAVHIWTGVELGHAVLRVTDNGIGIPEDALAKVFERFYRVDNSRARDTGGTGLGLAIVKHAATVHNAQVALNSEFGCGTTVVVTFPLT